MPLRIASIIMFPLFILSIAVQYNDPDSEVWMIAYGVPAVYSALAIWGRVDVAVLPIAAVYVVFAAMLMPWAELGSFGTYVSSWHMKNSSAEEMREALGLFICAAYMTYLSFTWWRRQPRKS